MNLLVKKNNAVSNAMPNATPALSELPVQTKAKDALIAFLRHTREGNETYTFRCFGSGAAFVHRMRVELSRLRQKAKERGMPRRYFKVRTENIVQKPNEDAAIVTLRRDDRGVNAVYGELDEIIKDEIAL